MISQLRGSLLCHCHTLKRTRNIVDEIRKYPDGAPRGDFLLNMAFVLIPKRMLGGE